MITNAGQLHLPFLKQQNALPRKNSEPALQEFQLVVGGMKALAENRYDSSLILDAFLLRSLSNRRLRPIDDANVHAVKNLDHIATSHLVGGGSVCMDCRPSASATPAAETLELMGDLISGNWDRAQNE